MTPYFNFAIVVAESSFVFNLIKSPIFVTRLSFTSIVDKSGPQYAVFNAKFNEMSELAVFTLHAVLGVAIMLSMLERSGAEASYSIRKLFIYILPVHGLDVLISFKLLGSYTISPPSVSI